MTDRKRRKALKVIMKCLYEIDPTTEVNRINRVVKKLKLNSDEFNIIFKSLYDNELIRGIGAIAWDTPTKINNEIEATLYLTDKGKDWVRDKIHRKWDNIKWWITLFAAPLLGLIGGYILYILTHHCHQT